MTERDGRRAIIVAASAALITLAASAAPRPAPLLLWNASASSPVGLYLVHSHARLRVGDTAIAWLPPAVRRTAARRKYLPEGVPLVKPVAAVTGARVCAHGPSILVNGRMVATRLREDHRRRRLSWWSGCRILSKDEIFLLSTRVPDAFDGRYFGVTRAVSVIGQGQLLWAP